jgi:hypothetical protein
VLQDEAGHQEMDVSLAERWSEGADLVSTARAPYPPDGSAS